MQKGNSIPVPSEYNEFAQSFGYEPTVDQQQSFDELMKDLAGKKPMDRLICGDVGLVKLKLQCVRHLLLR